MLTKTLSKIKPPIAAGLKPAHPLAHGLVGCWLLNEGAGRAAHDATGHHHDGSFSGAPLWRPGKFGHAVEFDGYDDWISMGDCLDLGTDDVTLFAIVKYSATIQPEETGGIRYAAVAGKGYLGPNEKGYGLFIRDNHVAWQTRNLAANFYAISDNTLNDKQYHTAVGVCDRNSSTGVMLYIDGVRQAMTGDPTILNGLDLSGPQAFAMGSRQDQAGTWLFDFQGTISAVCVWKRVLAEGEIRQLQRDPFVLFACRPAVALLGASAGVVVDCTGSIVGQSSAPAIVRVTRDLIASAHVDTLTSATSQVIRNMSGTSAVSTTLVGVLTQSGIIALAGTARAIATLQGTLTTTVPLAAFEAMLDNESFWLREALFNGMTSVAFKLGTALAGGWFWTRRQGCTAVYRGAAFTQVDLSSVLYVTDIGAKELSLPAYLSHVAGRTYRYLVRRCNSCGCQEQTTHTSVVVRIAPDGTLEPSAPNAVIALKGEQIASMLRLAWFYCPLDQKAAPECFNVYWDNGSGRVDYENPVAKVAYTARKFYRHHSEILTVGQYTFAIRAEGATHRENDASAEIICQTDDRSPEMATMLVVETT